MGVLDDTALDVEKTLPELQGDLAGLAAALGPLAALGLHQADGGDDGGGTAGEDLDEGALRGVVAPLVDGDPALLGAVTEVAGDLEEGVAGDAA